MDHGQRSEAYLRDVASPYFDVIVESGPGIALSTGRSEKEVEKNVTADLESRWEQYKVFTIEFYEEGTPNVRIHDESPVEVTAEDIRENILQ